MKQEEKKQYKNLAPWVQDAIDRYPAVTWTHANSVPLFLAKDSGTQMQKKDENGTTRAGNTHGRTAHGVDANSIAYAGTGGAGGSISFPGIAQLTGDDKPRTFPRYNADERGVTPDPIHPPVSDPPVPNRAHTEM